MKKFLLFFLFCLQFSCTGVPKPTDHSLGLYQVLTQQENGGASIRFYEILSEPNEIKMLQKDPLLKNKIKASDLIVSNFLILNMGEKNTSGYAIGVENVTQTDKNIIVTVKETIPESAAQLMQSRVYPFCVVKINSKKEIIIK
ncbi:protease complex subunit PrcB family protein [Flavobacterium crassostreae]|uniref:PrcB C-terminal domain-containing protein n=1 Tax=Flavobacterium crassostreae TaxID=1763534 RepID=A0A1B9DYX0_9FLAO|nr:protease complex subunit PrcB family protein [Flavobacterium crassostreae]OCB74867.1 hypothetical protein LPBF_09660 [Flavobacterium crassostreae]